MSFVLSRLQINIPGRCDFYPARGPLSHKYRRRRIVIKSHPMTMNLPPWRTGAPKHPWKRLTFTDTIGFPSVPQDCHLIDASGTWNAVVTFNHGICSDAQLLDRIQAVGASHSEHANLSDSLTMVASNAGRRGSLALGVPSHVGVWHCHERNECSLRVEYRLEMTLISLTTDRLIFRHPSISAPSPCHD